ncbi:hypothetical protein C2G38_2036732 [Gigaspora rosea]|uniref:TLDc domain-containing protein n=1 Tax=Gigaspora rosea TaxID=44941 RepID=A0A397VFJ3_9GLOM|nr:hypothetical protein C2G38_2036732 [Gigaspora rosea]
MGKKNTQNLPSELDHWTDEDFKSLKATLRNCLPHIRYFQIPCNDVLKKIQPYQHILEKDILDDVISKFINPNIFITSTFLPPRIKKTTQLPLRGESIIIPSSSTITLQEASNIIPSSSIISLQHAAEISSWIDRRPTVYDVTKIPYVFKLLLRGSRDGFACEIFHKLCDNIPGTIVVAKNYSTDEIVGGYDPLIWKIYNVRSERVTTADSFIFSLENRYLNKSILSRVKDASRAILYGDYITLRGPWFGSDLGMRDKACKNSKTWYCTNHFYEHRVISCVSSRFPVDDYEVFQIIKI